MVNEMLQAENLLKGNGVNANCIYGHCYLLSKYYLERGCDALETRINILKWAKDNHVIADVRELNLNQVIFKAEADKRPLRKDVSVFISEYDIQAIAERFDKPKVRKAALAILCLAKASADKDHVIQFSVVGLANWIGVSQSLLYENILSELKTMGYCERTKRNKKRAVFTWDRGSQSKAGRGRFTILIPYNNNGFDYLYQLKDNDINALFSQCFES